MIQMSFHLSDKVQILFKFWKVSSITGFVGSLVAVLAVSMIYECIKSYFMYKFISSHMQSHEIQPVAGEIHWVKQTLPQHIKLTIMHLVTVLLGYFVMLMAMTYNGWVFVVVVAGCGVGYFVTAPVLDSSLNKSKGESTARLLSYDHTPTGVI